MSLHRMGGTNVERARAQASLVHLLVDGPAWLPRSSRRVQTHAPPPPPPPPLQPPSCSPASPRSQPC
eukprot:5985990-Pleurochrysis_carterae.AAC.1